MDMKLAAVKAIAAIVEKDKRADYIIPKPFDSRVLPAVATSVAKAAVDTGVAPKDTDLDWIEYKAKNILRK
jgi:malate dehydrogenase (oxaloacetate-decarboxylating)